MINHGENKSRSDQQLLWRMTPDAAAAASTFCTDRAMELVREIWGKARNMDSRATAAAAGLVAEKLREAGLDDAAVMELPSTGRTSAGGWLLPVAWTADLALLEIPARRGQPAERLADYAACPQTLAMYSPGTPRAGWVEGPVVSAPDAASAGDRLRGAFLLLPEQLPSPELNARAAAAGALAVIAGVPNADPDAARYLNYAVPLDAHQPCIPCFSLSVERRNRLAALLQENPGLHLRARVRARRADGSMPLVTATLGRGEPSVYLCAHLDEIGAQDNASGVAVAIESLRALAAFSRQSGAHPALRAIRVFLSVEVRGLQAYLNRPVPQHRLLAGLNIDMVGRVPNGDAERFVLGRGFPGQAHFAHHLLDAAARLADTRAGCMNRVTRRCGVSDAVVGLHPEAGHVSLEQKTGPTYHSSADTPATLSREAMQWSGMAATAFLHAMTRFDHRDALGLARGIVRRSADTMRCRPAEAETIRTQAAAELDSLRRVMRAADLFGNWNTPADLYKAGVRRSTGCWPAVEDRKRLESVIAELPATPAGTATPPPAQSRARREASSLVPQATFRGFLSFEDHTTPDACAALSEALALTPGWSTETWAWLLASRMRGKATVAEVVDELGGQGVAIDMEKAVALTRYLVKIGKARLRPILSPADLRRTFKAIGVRRGSVLCVQSSLSRFGYIPGGPETLVKALLDVLGPRGTLCIPTHSLSVLGAAPYDPQRSPSVVGAVSEYFLGHPGVVRSPHPTHSVAACGPDAHALTHLDDPDSAPFARDGFWGKFYDAGGDVLLLCPIGSPTIFHVGEVWAAVPQPLLIAHRVDADGRRRVVTLPHAPWHVDHFKATMADPLLQAGMMRSAALGEDTIRFAPARAMADISVAVNRANPMISLGRNGACACFYCQAVRRGAARENDAIAGAEGK